MHGRTTIPALGTSVRQDALNQVAHRIHQHKTVLDAVHAATDGAREGTIRAAVRDYINGLSEEGFKSFCQAARRRATSRIPIF